MKRDSSLIIIVIALPLLAFAGCDQQEPATEGAMPGMGQRGGDVVEHTGEGTLNSIDQASGMVNISHGPVASAGWPSMTMSFKLSDPKAAAQFTPGQRVEFQFMTEGGEATITRISPAK